MNKLTTIMVGATAVGLATSLAVVATSANASTPASQRSSASEASALGGRYDTNVKFLNFDHTRGYGSTTNIRGQVIATVGSQRGGVKGVRVKLYRKLNGSSDWKYLDTDYTSQKARPTFKFTPNSIARARYRVVYEGNRHIKPSRNATNVAVYRHFDSELEDGSGRFHGRATPHYAHKTIYLDKRRCASCGWHRARTAETRRHGKWSFKVSAPSSGRWWWRVTTPASTHFIRSHSSVFSTSRS